MYDNNFRLEGTILERFNTIQVTDTFRKREFVLKVTGAGDSRDETIKFQCVQSNISLLDEVRVGNRVVVSFRVTGREWSKDSEKSYFNNLDCLDIDVIDGENLEDHTPDSLHTKNMIDEIIPAAGFSQAKSSSGEDWLSGSNPGKDNIRIDHEFDDLPF